MGNGEQSRGSDIVARVNGVVGRLKWRVRAQSALRLGLITGAIGLTLFAAAIALTKLRLVDPSTPLYAGIGAIALGVIGLTIGLTRRLDEIRLAASLDAAASLHSRLGTALAFARLESPTEMQRLAMEDALTVLDQAEPRRAAPWIFAPFIAGLVALALALALNVPALWLLDPKVPAGSVGMLSRVAMPAPFQRQVVVLAPEDKQTLEVLAEDLEETKTESDPKVKEALAELNELIRALQEGRITAEDAHARLAELEKALDEWEAQDKEQRAAEEKLAEAARDANKTIKKTEATLAEALSELQKRELEEAARRLEELQKKLDRGELDKKTQEKLAKDLAELAKGLKSERQKEKERLQKEKDRLKEKERKEKDRFAQKDRDRLKDLERQLETFDQDQPPASEAQRQLERLSDDFDEAAQDLMRRLSEKMGPLDLPQQEEGPEDIARRERKQNGQQGQDGQEGQEGEQGQEGKQGDQGDDLTDEELEQAAKALKRMAKRAGGRQQMRSAGGKMVDLKEMLRRAAKQGQGEGDDSQEAFEKSARGEGKDGQDGKGQAAGGQKPGGKGGDMMLLGGKGQGQGQGGAKVPGKGQGGQANDGLGEGIGEGHDRNLVGEKTGMDVKTVEDFVEGKANDGPSQTKVIMAAAGRGFASRAYREVHQDYAGVVEDALEKEQIPAGKRSYVRRYFDLIRPR